MSKHAVFRPGKHTAMNGTVIEFTEAMCADVVASYDRTLSEAPYVVGHPKTNGPAYAWVESLSFSDGFLYTTPRQVNAEFAEAVNAGSFKKRSASFYLPDSPGNPKPGHHYLRHVGWLGAAAPAVKGLPDVSFSSTDEGIVEFALDWEDDLHISMWRGIRDYLIEKEGLDKAELILPSWRIESLTTAMNKPEITQTISYSEGMMKPIDTIGTADFSERENALIAREATILARELELKQEEQQKQKTALIEFAGQLVTEGKIHPGSAIELVEALNAMSTEPVSFASGDETVTKSPVDIIKDVLSKKPAIIDFSEKSGPDKTVTDTSLDFSDPTVLAQAAVTYQYEQKQKGVDISTTDAVAHVQKVKQ